MRAFYLHGACDLRGTTVPDPVAAPGQLVLRVRQGGICGSDIHYFQHGRAGSFVPKRPFALGHEFVGEVAAIGSGVEGWEIGARAAVDPSMPCGQCDACRSGRYNLCPRMRYLGSASCDPHLDGAFAEFVAMPARNCQAVPDQISDAEATLLEPLAVALHAVNRAGSVAGRTVLVMGGGAIGQLIALVARTFGARTVVLADPALLPRETATAGGADDALDPAAPDFDSAAETLAPGGFDVVLEAAGARASLVKALEIVRRGGTVVQVGTLPPEVPLPANLIMAKELTVVGSFRFAHVFEIGLRLLAADRIKIGQLVSATYPHPEIPAAMDRAVNREGVIKVHFRV